MRMVLGVIFTVGEVASTINAVWYAKNHAWEPATFWSVWFLVVYTSRREWQKARGGR